MLTNKLKLFYICFIFLSSFYSFRTNRYGLSQVLSKWLKIFCNWNSINNTIIGNAKLGLSGKNTLYYPKMVMILKYYSNSYTCWLYKRKCRRKWTLNSSQTAFYELRIDNVKNQNFVKIIYFTLFFSNMFLLVT